MTKLISTSLALAALLAFPGVADAGWRYTSTGPNGGYSTYCIRTVYGVDCNTTPVGARIGNDARVVTVPQNDVELPPPSERTCRSPSVICLKAIGEE